MKLKLPNFSHSLPRVKLSITYLNWLVWLAVLVIVFFLGQFLYENLYQTVTQAREVADLRREVAPAAVNVTIVNEIVAAIDKKTKTNRSVDWDTLRHPFINLEAVVSVPVSPTTTPTQ